MAKIKLSALKPYEDNPRHNDKAVKAVADSIKRFVDELGFSKVLGTNRIPTATLNSYAIALKGLERKYGAIAASDNPVFMTGSGKNGTLAAIYYNPQNPAIQHMVINTSYIGTTKTNLAEQRYNEKTGWGVKTDGKITTRNASTVTHEYGHMLENAMVARGIIRNNVQARNEITEIAVNKYGAKKNGSPSGYARDSGKASEFFAESFASANSGNPSAYGKAMNDWLGTHSLK